MPAYTLPPILTAILGSTNTGKTHYAVERMLGRSSGIIGLPLRLLAREIYDRIVKIKGPNLCALITGEEKIIPNSAMYYVCTVEAMPTTKRFAFVAIDEIQLAAHSERGHIFTDRLLNMRGTEETLFLGSESIRPLIRTLVPDARHETRERFSTLSYAGASKLTKLPKRSVIVAFSASEVYAMAEMMRRHRGGAAVVMGGLSPRTRNAQAALYQSGEVDFLIATDAVGMGLNLDVDHVSFAALRKFDGRRKRFLTPAEAAQIAGRAGRFRNDGTFGTTGRCTPMDDALVGRIENHMFEPLRGIEWRNSKLDISGLSALQESLSMPSPHRQLYRASNITDELSLERLITQDEIADTLIGGQNPHAARLWDVCQIPDFRDTGLDSHLRLLADIYLRLLSKGGRLPEDWMARQTGRLNHVDGSIETLSMRLMQIRTWTYVSNKANWLKDVRHWREKTRAIEDQLSDALHERLIQKFVDRRTSALIKGLGTRTYMDANISAKGEVTVEGHFVGQLDGLTFTIDPNASGAEAKAVEAAARQTVGPEVDRRMTSMIGAQHEIFTLQDSGRIKWGEAEIGQLSAGKDLMHPEVSLLGAQMGQQILRDHLAARLSDFIQTEIRTKLDPLQKLEALTTSTDVAGEARGFSYRLLELNGLMVRRGNEKLLKELGNNVRSDLRGAGVRFGQYYVFMPELLKPAPSKLLAILHAFSEAGDGKPFIPYAGVTSVKLEQGYSEAALNAAGFTACGSRILRVDIANRFADTVRQARGESGGGYFQIAMEMMAMLGSTYDECKDVLRSLGYKSRPAKPEEIMKPVPELNAAPTVAAPSNAAPSAVEAKPDAASSSAPTSDPAPAPAPETPSDAVAAEIVAAPITPNAIGIDGKPKLNMPAAPKAPAPKKKKGPQPLNYYQPITHKSEEGADIRGVQDEVWFMAPRRNFKPREGGEGQGQGQGSQGQGSGGARKSGGDHKSGRGTDKFKGQGKGGSKHKKGRDQGRDERKRQRPTMSAAPKKPASLEDSPFAALAALKMPKKD